MSDEASRMMALFQGYSGAHGSHGTPSQKPGSLKRAIKDTARTIREPVTVDLWRVHLSGASALGIIPITERETCWWGAVDIDKYDLVHSDIVRQLAEIRAPAVVCRSKSGGAHVYIFMREEVSASLMRAKLRDLASVLGHGESEIYPKQDHVLADQGHLGNWMSMPYMGGDRSEKYAINESGRGLTVRQFLDLAEARRMSRRELEELSMTRRVPEMQDGPPCLEHLSAVKITRGSQNNGLFNLGVLAQRMQPDNWESLLEDWNIRFLSPPAPGEDVASIVKSLRKKQYNYKCGDQPISSHCNMQVCRLRPHGIGPSSATRIIESVSVLDTDPPLFFVSLRTGQIVECDARVLLEPRQFQLAALAQTRMVLPLAKLDDWLRQAQECMDKATVIEAPREVGLTGQLEELIDRFCTDRHAAEERDEIILGKPWRDDESGRVWFRLRDLQEFLDRARFREFTRGQITTRIRNIGGGTSFTVIRGKGTNLWYVPVDRLSWAEDGVRVRGVEDTPL